MRRSIWLKRIYVIDLETLKEQELTRTDRKHAFDEHGYHQRIQVIEHLERMIALRQTWDTQQAENKQYRQDLASRQLV